MRHLNPIRHSLWDNRRSYICDKPYEYGLFSYTRPSGSVWFKILQYVYDHPECTRNEILSGVFNDRFPTPKSAKTQGRGYMSSVFANMLYDDLIDYDKSYHYTIMAKGKSILEDAYTAINAKTLVAKLPSV